MGKRFYIFLAAGMAVVAVLISGILVGTKSSHLELTGNILKVRVLALGEKASLVVLDFRVTNLSAVPFVIGSVSMKLEPSAGEAVEGSQVSRVDMETVFQAQKLIGPHFNDVLTLRDKIGGRQTLDRMTGARFELPESAINQRRSLRLRLEDVDGTVAEITEK
jgi:hypothetical protein